jgi:hypothetical protein
LRLNGSCLNCDRDRPERRPELPEKLRKPEGKSRNSSEWGGLELMTGPLHLKRRSAMPYIYFLAGVIFGTIIGLLSAGLSIRAKALPVGQEAQIFDPDGELNKLVTGDVLKVEQYKNPEYSARRFRLEEV